MAGMDNCTARGLQGQGVVINKIRSNRRHGKHGRRSKRRIGRRGWQKNGIALAMGTEGGGTRAQCCSAEHTCSCRQRRILTSSLSTLCTCRPVLVACVPAPLITAPPPPTPLPTVSCSGLHPAHVLPSFIAPHPRPMPLTASGGANAVNSAAGEGGAGVEAGSAPPAMKKAKGEVGKAPKVAKSKSLRRL